MRNSLIIITVALISVVFLQKNQAQVLNDSIYNETIKTIQLYREGYELSYPVIELNSADRLIFSFDDLTNKAGNYYYTIIHCNSDWEPSNIVFSEYADGFSDNRIMNFAFSTNTTVNYVHYKLTIPSEECRLKLSGNYIIKVYNDMDESKPLITRKFYVYENLATIDLNVIRAQIPYFMNKGHQADMKITLDIEDITDPYHQIKVNICQNFDFANAHIKQTPVFVDNKVLQYNDLEMDYFKGLNEFRSFDMAEMKTASYRIISKEFNGNYFLANIETDESRAKKQFLFVEDMNGKYYIENKRGVNKDLDADYVMVRFKLAWPGAPIDGNIYVYGGLTDWQCNVRNKMLYDPVQKVYVLDLMLKQGFYNYYYAWKEKPDSPPDIAFLEGSHFETEDDYLVFVYYQFPDERFERLIGYTIGNSQNKKQ